MKGLLQTGSSGRVPAPLEKRFLINGIGACLVSILFAWPLPAWSFASCDSLPSATAQPGAHSPALGLTVSEEGVLLKNGKPYRGIGVNYFGLFYFEVIRRNGGDDLYDGALCYTDGLRILAEHEIPFVRFTAVPFWPKQWHLYQTDKEKYFLRFDAIVAKAEEYGIGLIPSLFWQTSTISDLVGEPRDQWGNPDSNTHAFMRKYTREVVTRYQQSPAIWAWEFGNEFNLPADLPNADRHRPTVNVALGTPPTRSARDDITGETIVAAFREFATLVRQLDPHRPILSGNSAPRPFAWHNAHENSWSLDSREQFSEMLLRDNPDPMDMLTIHLYVSPDRTRFPDEAEKDELIRVAMATAKQARKPLFLGEFGASRGAWPDQAREPNKNLFHSIVDHGVPLAAFWVFGYPPQEGSFNIAPDNEGAYIFELIRAANRTMREAAPSAREP